MRKVAAAAVIVNVVCSNRPYGHNCVSQEEWTGLCPVRVFKAEFSHSVISNERVEEG